VVRRKQAYAERFGSKVADDTHDPIGRAWAAGLLDGTRVDPAMLRDMGRRYAQLHAVVYRQTQCAVADNDRVRGTGLGNDNDPTGERYNALDQLARDAGSKQRLAMQKLVLHPNPDENPLWLDRLLRDAAFASYAAMTKARGATTVFLPCGYDRDRMILTQAVQALVAMVEG